MILELKNISKSFGGVVAINDVSFSVRRGEIFGLIGPNGAGKTTLLNIITGAYKPTSGTVEFDGKNLDFDQLKAVRAGIARTFQNIRLFSSMSALENVMLCLKPNYGLFEAFLHLGRFCGAEARAQNQALELLARLDLAQFASAKATALSYGQQRKLEIARALALSPKLLLLDEPAAGMNSTESDELATIIQQIASSGTSVLLIEHDMKFIKRLCDRVLVLDYGRTLCCAAPEEALAKDEVIAAYLGDFDAKSE